MNIMRCSLHLTEFSRVSSCTSAKEIWNCLMVIYEGTSEVKETKDNMLVSEYEAFKMKHDETISEMHGRLTLLTNGLKNQEKTYTEQELFRKILRSLTPVCHTKATVVEESRNLSTTFVDELIGSLMTYELGLKRAEEDVKKKKPLALKASLGIKEATEESESSTSEDDSNDDKKKISLNSKAKSILCCALSKKEFNIISACTSAMEMWEKLRITYEGTYKVKETRIDILVAQYERFQMQSGESITQMYNRFTDITNNLAGLEKIYEIGDMMRKILRCLTSWTPKVTAIEEANDLRKMSLERLIGSLMAHEINMERLGESSSRKKHSNALKAT
ncbi:hypothetical protein Taro_021385 [Colocasia esculenta]|uniref:UBN2 domain-containing protein n=1 Tax=Colocasia esculenta TaxID=4460 RepID=A0A843UYV4_COLES|nr:hypothetical protein [Colocasia esculenta]